MAVLERAAGHACSAYKIPNVDVESRAVYTNNVPCGAMRGFGVNQTNFANPGSSLSAPAAISSATPNAATNPYSNPVGALSIQPGQAFTQSIAGSSFGVLASTVEKSVGLGTNRQIQFALKLNF